MLEPPGSLEPRWTVHRLASKHSTHVHNVGSDIPSNKRCYISTSSTSLQTLQLYVVAVEPGTYVTSNATGLETPVPKNSTGSRNRGMKPALTPLGQPVVA